ncbi:pilus assembly protein CpaC [Polaromonas sp. OV174]|uniref:type II and III secretion system protein family protein n=1 Tax=Polaromonas sp. OV174 TaxID=1855300 RepID=UPI0008DEACE6|nr:pilus assembly protein CpaC [Polaromonas sp. OV174]
MQKKYKNLILLATLALTGQSFGQDKPVINPAPRATSGLKPCVGEVRVDPPTYLALGKSRVIRLDFPAARMLVGGQSSSRAGRAVAPNDKPAPGTPANAPAAPAASAQGSDGVADLDITLLSPRELFFLGKKAGSMNVVLQSADGRCVVKDIIVTIDPDTLQAKLTELMPEETGIKVRGAENAIVLTGKVSDAIKLDEVMSLATAYGDGKKVVNMLRISTPQQVMLEVKIAEVSKTLLDRFGIDYSRLLSSGSSASFLSGIFGGGPAIIGKLAGKLDFAGNAGSGFGGPLGRAGATLAAPELPLGAPPRAGSASLLGIEAQKRDGLIRVLAEPNIMAISGQSASFLSGGRIFIPVAQTREGGGSTITLEEKEFGVGLKFLPTVLDGTRINLKLVSEVSELAQTGSAFTTVGGVTSVLPSITSRRVDTTVQLNDGQSFAIAGLIKNNVTESVSRFPGVGEVPVLGTLFRSTEFQNDQTELIFVITPRLVKPLTTAVMLPTDNHIIPSRSEVILNGATESASPPKIIPTNPAAQQ